MGGVEEIMRQHASLLGRYGHHVEVLAGYSRKSADNMETEVNTLLGSRNREVLDDHQLSFDGKPEKMEVPTREICRFLLGSLKGFDILIAHNVLSIPFNLPLSTALYHIGHEQTRLDSSDGMECYNRFFEKIP